MASSGSHLTVLPLGLTGQQAIGHSTLFSPLLVLSEVEQRGVGVVPGWVTAWDFLLLLLFGWLGLIDRGTCQSILSSRWYFIELVLVNLFSWHSLSSSWVHAIGFLSIVLTDPAFGFVRQVFRVTFLSRVLAFMFLAWVRLVFCLRQTAQAFGNQFSWCWQTCQWGFSHSLLLF